MAQQEIRSGDVQVQPGVGLDYDVARIASIDKLHARAVGLPGVLFLYAVPPEFLRNVVPDYPALDRCGGDFSASAR